MDDCFFGVDGDRFVPTQLCQGPWDPGHAHGGPPSALIARAIERHEPDPDVALSRVVFDLVRPVPLVPLRVTTETVRPGKRVQIVEATMTSADGVELVRARALRVRRTPDSGGRAGAADRTPTVRRTRRRRGRRAPGPVPTGHLPRHRAALRRGNLRRSRAGHLLVPVPRPLVAGETPTPIQRAVVAADFGNGISQVLDQSHVFINPDLIVHFEREPVGEWIALAATTRIVPGQGAVAAGVLFDETGRIGQSEQSLYVAARG